MLLLKFCYNGNHESDSIQSTPGILKYCYKLSSKSLSSTNLGRQNVNLVLQIFNEHMIL